MLYLWSLDTFCLLLSELKWPALLSPLPSSLLFLFPSTPPSSPCYPLFSLAWDTGRVMTEVSAQVTVIRSCCSVPTGLGVNTFLPVLSPHQSAPCVLRIYIPARQELPPFSLPGVWLHWTIVGEKPVWTFLFLIFHLFFQSPRLVIVHVPVSFSPANCSPFLIIVHDSLSLFHALLLSLLYLPGESRFTTYRVYYRLHVCMYIGYKSTTYHQPNNTNICHMKIDVFSI